MVPVVSKCPRSGGGLLPSVGYLDGLVCVPSRYKIMALRIAAEVTLAQEEPHVARLGGLLTHGSTVVIQRPF